MPNEKKIQIGLGIVAFSALFWGVQAQNDILLYLAFGCMRLLFIVGVYYSLEAEQKKTIQAYAISLFWSLFMILLLYGYVTGQRLITFMGIGMLVSLVGALGHRGNIWTGTSWGITQIHVDLLIYSVSLAVSFWIRIVSGNDLGEMRYLLVPFVFGTLVAVGSGLKGDLLSQLRHNIVVLLSFGVCILVSMWLCIRFVIQYLFHN